ncbi:MAG: hypothetical protein LBE08_13765 [Bifidobacteriaceae bacterium]|jgi:hypothetical protein|nr:hypothetical protein [Bifidobacteriaceae bacterium]
MALRAFRLVATPLHSALRRGDGGSHALELEQWLNANRAAKFDADGLISPATGAAAWTAPIT